MGTLAMDVCDSAFAFSSSSLKFAANELWLRDGHSMEEERSRDRVMGGYTPFCFCAEQDGVRLCGPSHRNDKRR